MAESVPEFALSFSRHIQLKYDCGESNLWGTVKQWFYTCIKHTIAHTKLHVLKDMPELPFLTLFNLSCTSEFLADV